MYSGIKSRRETIHRFTRIVAVIIFTSQHLKQAWRIDPVPPSVSLCKIKTQWNRRVWQALVTFTSIECSFIQIVDFDTFEF